MTRFVGLVATWALTALVLFCAGCPRKEEKPARIPLPQVPAPSLPDKPVDAVDKTELEGAPDAMMEDVDDFYVRLRHLPTRAAYEKKPEVLYNARRLLLGKARVKQEAHKSLTDSLPMASAFFLLPAVQALAKEHNIDKYVAEDAAMEVVYVVQQTFLRGGDMQKLLEYFAAVTGKDLLVEKKILEIKKIFDIRNVYPLPALSRVADHLQLEYALWKGIDSDAPELELSTRMAFNLKVHNVEISWLLQALARVEGLNLKLQEEVRGPVSLRVRAGSGVEAIRQIAEAAGYSLKTTGNTLRVSRQ